MKILAEHLSQTISAQEVAEYLKIDVQSVRKYNLHIEQNQTTHTKKGPTKLIVSPWYFLVTPTGLEPVLPAWEALSQRIPTYIKAF